MMSKWSGVLEKIDDYSWLISRKHKPGMMVDGLVFAGEEMLNDIMEDKAIEQVANVAFLPGIIGYSLAMPDIHLGYGFPIGGVAAMDVETGVVSPGGVGFDINCGIRLLRSNLMEDEVKQRVKQLADSLYRSVPSGVGSEGKIKLKSGEIDDVLVQGSHWAVKRGFGRMEDLETTEDKGEMEGAQPQAVSSRARERGKPQLGTLGSGNHFLEVAVVDQIMETSAARVMGIDMVGQVVLMVHCGSRGLGHQVADDYIRKMIGASDRYNMQLPDRQLACAPIESEEGREYLAAMRCAANYAWANRQCITHWVRQTFCDVMGKSEKDAGLELVYDVAHNIAKIEQHMMDGRNTKLCVHRKGATRAFPAGHPDVPAKYAEIGQPVLIPGDMGRYSYILVGTQAAMGRSFGSTCHGAGRMKSRAAAKRQIDYKEILRDLENRGITIRTGNLRDLAEEAPDAYKDVAGVVRAASGAGLSKIVARTRPLIVIKG
ncbi:MAG: RtcB family protein [Dehalococcoidia bacterium]|nr:RtcB family protein [Dehalococcoidia bacterium]